MKPVEVEIRVALDGSITPLRFKWSDRPVWMKIAQISRTWTDDSGDHWLLMAAASPTVFELLRTPEGLWQMKVAGGPPSFMV